MQLNKKELSRIWEGALDNWEDIKDSNFFEFTFVIGAFYSPVIIAIFFANLDIENRGNSHEIDEAKSIITMPLKKEKDFKKSSIFTLNL